MPYRNVFICYPPGALIPIIVPGLLADNYEQYYFLMGAWLGLLYLINLFLCLGLMSGRRASTSELNRMLWWSVAFLLLFGNIAAARFDHYVVFITLISALFFSFGIKKKGGYALPCFAGFGLLCAIGFMTKIVPVLLLPVALVVMAAQPGRIYPWRGQLPLAWV